MTITENNLQNLPYVYLAGYIDCLKKFTNWNIRWVIYESDGRKINFAPVCFREHGKHSSFHLVSDICGGIVELPFEQPSKKERCTQIYKEFDDFSSAILAWQSFQIAMSKIMQMIKSVDNQD